MSYRSWFSIFLLGYGVSAWSTPWIAPDNLSLRSSITYLQQQGVIHAPLSTWPLAWQSIAEDLDHCAQQALPPNIVDLCHTLLNEYHASQISHINVQAYVANDQTLLNSFDKNYRGKSGSQFNFSAQDQHWSGQLSFNQVDASTDHHAMNLDGSYLAIHSDNWALGAGAVDRWWGPGWDSSLILSTNPRPIPGLFLTRTSNKPFESTLLHWIGPWNFTTTLGQLESNREIPHTLFFGVRFNFRPWTPLEIGLSRTALWGGKGRSHSLSTFSNLLVGYDNNPDNEPGDQLAGFDATLSFPINNYTSALYFQYIGEDEAGGLPAKSLGLAGASLSKANTNNHWTAFIEASDTAVNVLSSDTFNVAYEHHLYTDGYRYYGRAIGSTYDNDTHTMTLGLTGTINEIHQFSATASNINFNLDGNAEGNGLVRGAQKSQRYAFTYKQKNLLADWGFTLSTLTHLPDNKMSVDKKDNLIFFVSRDFK